MTIFGWDMSHYDAPSIGNAVTEGIEFITHKAGGDGNDTELPAWWSGVKNDAIAGRILAGAYWVLYPGIAAARADAFISRLDAACPGWRNVPFLLQVDCERWNGDASTMPHKADIEAFCDRLVWRLPKLRPIVYAPAWAYGSSLAGLSYPLWASSYVTGSGSFKSLYPGDSSSRWGAYSGQVPAILQYTSSATIGGQTFSDANAYRGTLKQLTALAAPGWSEDMTISNTDVHMIFNTDGQIDSPSGADSTDPTWTAAQFLRNGYNEAKSAHDSAAGGLAQSRSNGSMLSVVSSKLDMLLSRSVPSAEEIAAAVVPLLPDGALTPEQVTEAVKVALREGAATA